MPATRLPLAFIIMLSKILREGNQLVKLRSLSKALALLAVCGCLLTTAYAGSEQAGTSGAAFLKLGQSVRAASLGESFVALAEDPSAIFYNPAGLQLSGYSRFSFTQTSWLVGSSYSTVCYTRPMGLTDTMGIALSYLSAGDIQETTAANRTGTGRIFNPSSILGVFSWAKDTPVGYVGLSAKILRQNIDSLQEDGIGMDVGLLTRTPVENLRFGTSFLNLGWITNKALPQTLVLGVDYKTEAGIDVISDLRLPRDAAVSLHLGAERQLTPFLSLRGGFNNRNDEGAGGNISLGLGLLFSGLTVDYAYVPYADLGNTHRVNLLMEF